MRVRIKHPYVPSHRKPFGRIDQRIIRRTGGLTVDWTVLFVIFVFAVGVLAGKAG